MRLVSLREYADANGVSYEAVRKQVNRYKTELEDHIVTQKGRGKLLDEWAVDFLTERRRESPLVLMTMDQGEEIKRLQEQVETLRGQLMAAQNALLEAQESRLKVQERVIELQDEARLMIAEKAKMDEQAARLEEAEAQIEGLREERDRAQKEVQSFRPSWFGLYKKV